MWNPPTCTWRSVNMCKHKWQTQKTIIDHNSEMQYCDMHIWIDTYDVMRQWSKTNRNVRTLLVSHSCLGQDSNQQLHVYVTEPQATQQSGHVFNLKLPTLAGEGVAREGLEALQVEAFAIAGSLHLLHPPPSPWMCRIAIAGSLHLLALNVSNCPWMSLTTEGQET